MKKNNLKRFLASLLAVLMLASVTGVSPAVFADNSGNTATYEAGEYQAPKYHNGTAIIKKDSSDAEVRALVTKAIVENYNDVDPATLSGMEWEYYCTGNKTAGFGDKTKSEWVSINGKLEIGLATYKFPSLAENDYKSYQVRLKGTTDEYALTKADAAQSSIALNDYENGIKVPYNNDGSIDYALLKERILEKVVTNPVDADRSSITIEYSASPDLSKLGENTLIDKITEAASKEWTPLEGGSHKVIGIPVPYFAMTAGENKIKLSWGGDDTYYGCSSDEFTVNFLDRESAPLQRNDVSEIGIVYNEDLSVNYEATKEVIRNTLATSTDTEIVKTSDLKVEYKTATNYEDFGSDANIKPGTKKTIRLSWNGNADYSAWKEEFTVTFVDGRDPAFKLKDGVKDTAPEIGLVFKYDKENGVAIDYVAAETAIREALVEKLANVDLDKISVKYKSAEQAVDLNYKPSTVFGKAFGEGDFEIVLTWGGNKDYRSFSETVNVKMIDNRIASEIKVVSDPSITYNKDGSAEKSAIISSVIDYTNSTIPADAKFTVEVPNIDTPLGTTWKDITDNTMDAGENQKIRISFAGNAEYKPCEIVTTITVKKAPVSITLPIISKLYAGKEVDPETYYEVTPDDDAIDVYLFFVGVNTNKETCVNVKLTPDQEKLLKVIPSVYDKLREGMRLSEFKEFIESIPNIDKIEVIKNILNILNTFDNISDNTVIAIGTPAHAGVYQAIAVSPETKNYEAGKGTGSLIILKNWKGVKLEKSDMFTGSKNEITVTNATKIANGEEGAYAVVLKQNGVILSDNAQSAVHYLFTGINHGKLYSSSKMPVEPGRYIVTATVVGGDFFALPKTFSFKIVTDPTPETTPEA